MNMRRGVRWLVIVLIAVVAGAGLALAWFLRNPLTYHAWSTRRDLFQAGFVQEMAAGPAGRLAYYVAGEPGGAPSTPSTLVFLHGAGDQAGTWAEVAPAFAGGHRIVLVDLAGHGDSAPFEGPIPFDLVVEGFELLMAEAAPERFGPVVLVGSSLGAWAASVYAHRHPERVARLVLINGGPVRPELELSPVPEDREEARRLMAAVRAPDSEPLPGFVLDDLVERAATGPIGRLSEASETMEKYLLDGRLGEIRVPVEIVWGRGDGLLASAYAEHLAAELPRARLTWIESCGHLPQIECPERLRATLEGLLGRAAPSDPPT